MLLLIFGLSIGRLDAQTTVSTTTGALNNTEDAAIVTFNFQNTNAFPVVITDVESIVGVYGSNSAELWYKTTPINGAPGNISAVNGWTQLTSAVIFGVANTTTLTTQPIFSGISLTVPGNTTYGIAVSMLSAGSPAQRAATMTTSATYAAGGCNIIVGANVGYSSVNNPPSAPAATPIGWLGKIKFISGAACTGTPAVALASGPASICSNAAFALTTSGYAVGSTISYQWQFLNTSNVWTNIAGETRPTYINNTGITATTQYRMLTICSSNTSQSISNTVTVALGAGLAPGVYTIDNNAQSTSTNFINFKTATAALSCGVTGAVTFNVNPASGPYTEQVVVGKIPGASAVNRIRFNGNGAVVQSETAQGDPGVFTFRGAKYVKLDSLTIRSLSDNQWVYGVRFVDTCRYDSLTRCFIDIRSIQSVNFSNTCGIMLSSNWNNVQNEPGSCAYTYVGQNHILGTDGQGGPYYGIVSGTNYAQNVNSDTAITIDGNEIENFNWGGIYSFSNNGIKIINNDIHRTNKSAAMNFYGIYCWDGWNNINNNSSGNIEIVGNRIHDPANATVNNAVGTFYGIYTNSNYYNNNTNVDNGHTLIANNVIYNVQGTTNSSIVYGILFGNNNGINNNDDDTTYVYHNTIDFSKVINSTGTTVGIYSYDNWNNNNQNQTSYVKNNMITITAGTNGTKYGFYYNDFNNQTFFNIQNQRNNVYVNSTQPGSQFYCRYGAVEYPTLAAFQAAYPLQEMGSLSVNPQYENPAAGDFSPTNFALFNNGVNLQSVVPKDILGRTRSTSPTPGAFEIGVDAGISNLVAPLGTYCSSVKQVKVTLINAGITVLNTVQVNWSLNGVMQPAVTYNGPLQGINGSPNTATVTLGNGLFLPNTPVLIKVWTSAPNGQQDAMPFNDTLVVTTQSSTSVPVNLGPDAAICTGSTRTLDAGYPGSVYLWDNPSVNTQTRTISAAGTYYVRVTALDGCIGVDTFNLSLRPLPIVNLGPDVEICLGQTHTFDAGHPGSTYLWDDGSTAQTRTVDTEGVYEAQVTDQYGCMGFDNVAVGMKDIPKVDGINATHADSGTYTFYPLNPVYTINYSWDFGDGSPRANGYFVQHTYTQLGIYTVTLYLEGECTGLIIDRSRTVDVFSVTGGGSTGVHDIDKLTALNIYPNPANGWLAIEGNEQLKMQRLMAYNVLGQLVYEAKADTDNKHKMETSRLAPGLYTLKIETAEGVVTRKFEIMK